MTYADPAAKAANEKAYYEANREKRRAQVRDCQYRRKYGITTLDYEEMLRAQGEACAICRSKDNKGRRFSVDHDHETGRVRGLLCFKCNTALGQFGDNVPGLNAVIDYLRGSL